MTTQVCCFVLLCSALPWPQWVQCDKYLLLLYEKAKSYFFSNLGGHFASKTTKFHLWTRNSSSCPEKLVFGRRKCIFIPTNLGGGKSVCDWVCLLHCVCWRRQVLSDATDRKEKKKKKENRDGGESILDSFTRSKDSFSNHLVIACYYRRQRLCRHLLLVCNCKGKRQGVFLGWACAARLCVRAQKR